MAWISVAQWVGMTMPTSVMAASFMPAATPGGEPFLSGAASRVIETPAKISLAAYFTRRNWRERPTEYAHYFEASEGIHDAPHARTLFLQVGGRRVVFLSLDVVAISPQLKGDLLLRLRDLALPDESLFVSATHTHSGPGGYIDFKFWEVLAADKFIPAFYKTLLDTAEASVREAIHGAQPAELAFGQSRLPGFTANRRGSPYHDPLLTMIRINDLHAKPLGTMMAFPVHGDLMTAHNLLISADVPGALAGTMEGRTGVPTLFVSEAAGDIDPVGAESNFPGLVQYGQRFADQAAPLWARMDFHTPQQLSLAQFPFALDHPRIQLRQCLGVFLPFLLDTAWGHLVPAEIPLSTKGFDESAQLSAAVLDHHLILGIPGEPTTELAIAIRQAAARLGFASTTILGLTNSYQGYILSPQDFSRGGYETCNSFYGDRYGDRLLAAARSFLAKLTP